MGLASLHSLLSRWQGPRPPQISTEHHGRIEGVARGPDIVILVSAQPPESHVLTNLFSRSQVSLEINDGPGQKINAWLMIE